MLRTLHKLPALAAGLIVGFLALTGAMLALQPLTEQITTPRLELASGTNVAELASGVAQNFDGPVRLVRTAAGKYIVYQQTDSGLAANLVDPATGEDLGTYAPSALFGFLSELHRSLLLGDNGRLLTLAGAAAMLVLSFSGILLLVRRVGGWRRLMVTPKGPLSHRLHVELARLGLVVFVVLGFSGLWLSLSYFGWVGAEPAANLFSFPLSSEGTPLPFADLSALQTINLKDLRELVFPAVGDAQDVFTVSLASGSGFVDQVTGEWIGFTPNSIWQNIYQFAYLLHTGEGVWWYALVLGTGALMAPILALTGTIMWWKRRASRPAIRGNARAQKADIVILVGSENQTTWGFAAHLHEQLRHAGRQVHVAPMNALARSYARAETLLVLAATYGDGDAPTSARGFLQRLRSFVPRSGQSYSVLGFGDRSYPNFCGFSHQVDEALADTGLTRLLDAAEIDRQSTQQFSQWGTALGEALNVGLVLNHRIKLPRMQRWVLESRTDFGEAFQTPKSVLRFRIGAPQRQGIWGKLWTREPRFQPGDLIGILPPAGAGGQMAVPRYYSLGSSEQDGFAEICVSKQPGGLCSTYLCELVPGDEIAAFIKPNPEFHTPKGRAPVVMIGAGTGVAPFIGMLRGNRQRRQMFCYFGARDPGSDFMFEQELRGFAGDGRLTGLRMAFSRVDGRHIQKNYVQDRMRGDAELLRSLVKNGAHVMVCGGISMAKEVAATLDEILMPLGLEAATLRQKGRYMEDVYQ